MNIRAALFILFVVMAQILAACGTGGLSVATSAPSVAVTPTTDPLQSAKIVQAFWDALETGDLETAMAYVGDEVTCAGFCYFKGKETFRSYLQGYLEAGHLTKISDVKSVGSIVTYSWQVYRNGNFVRGGEGDEIMQVEDGKIVYWENQHR
jgi:limonene-1,2-epoxide hydrolase